MLSKRQYRALFSGTILLTALLLVVANAGYVLAGSSPEINGNADIEGKTVASDTNGTTVVTSEADGYITAIGPDGTVQYHDTTHDMYYDVDPVDDDTVIYAAVDHVATEECTPTTRTIEPVHMGCSKQMIEKANLTTGETTILHSRILPRRLGAEWHDVDKVGEHRSDWRYV